MYVRELIQELAKEENMDSSVYVRVKDKKGNIEFLAIDGIAILEDSFKPTDNITCTTLSVWD